MCQAQGRLWRYGSIVRGQEKHERGRRIVRAKCVSVIKALNKAAQERQFNVHNAEPGDRDVVVAASFAAHVVHVVELRTEPTAEYLTHAIALGQGDPDAAVDARNEQPARTQGKVALKGNHPPGPRGPPIGVALVESDSHLPVL